MRLDSLSRHFEAMGARVRFGEVDLPGRWQEPKTLREERFDRRFFRRLPAFTIDIADDRRGEYFDIRVKKGRKVGFEVLQALPKERHLLMMTDRGRRFLCGHDERHWFVAEIRRRVSTVRDARRALLPPSMQDGSRGMSSGILRSRKNGIFIRQGEWFFIPSDKNFDEALVLRDEPLQRSAGSKPHVCEQLVREGGRKVYVYGQWALTESAYASMKHEHRRRFRPMVQNPRVYVRGDVRHPDHSTIRLEGWHRVLLNTEKSSRNLAFLD